MGKPTVIVIAGPTASGKTALSISLAKKIGGEIVCADSMQIYQDMNIGTAKVTEEEKQGIPHYLVDFVSPEQRYSVSEFKKAAENAIEMIIKKGKVPIVVGGTGLYTDTLIYGIEFPEMEINEDYRKELQEQDLSELYEKAMQIDEEATKKISKTDRKRMIRILEIYKQTGKTKTELEKESRKNGVKYHYLVFALDMDRQKLYDKINKRVDKMREEGLVQEVQNLLKKYSYFPTAMQGLGYKEVKEYLENHITQEQMIEKIKQETRHYAKRQLTWFRKNKQTIWLNAENSIHDNVTRILSFLYKDE